MKSNLGTIIGREFKERVAKKSFIITTLLGPILMILCMAAPMLIQKFSTPNHRKIAVVDKSGVVLPSMLKEAEKIEYLSVVPSVEPVQQLIDNSSYDGVLEIGSDIVTNPSNATLYTHTSSSIEMEGAISGIIEGAVSDRRMKSYNIPDIDRIVEESKVSTSLKTVRVDEDGNEKDTSSGLSMALGMVMTFILYMFLLMYGQMVMTSIIEEKNNRVLELVVSSVKPTQLMMGKIVGVGLVAVVQIVLWALLVCGFVSCLMPMLMSDTMTADLAAFNAGTYNADTGATSVEMLQTLSIFSSVGYVAKLFMYMSLFLVGGFLFYASIFAAIGSSVDNVQDASQLTTFTTLPIILGFVIGIAAATDPNTPLAFWTSMIPFTSPMVMLVRIPFDIPAWEAWVSLAVLFASFVVMAWLAGKIYRVGIFMYGKKPNIRDLARWARYK